MIKWRILMMLSHLYSVQGIPYGFQSRFLPMYLRMKGLSLTNLGLMKLLSIPWLIKGLWAPFVDRVSTKKRWLQGSLSILFLACFLLAHLSVEYFSSLLFFLLVMNLAASVQDIAVDSVAISTLTSEDLGIGNVAQVVGYKFGAMIGGGFLITLINYFSWQVLFYALSAIYLVALSVVTLSSEFAGDTSGGKQAKRTFTLKTYLESIKAALSVPSTMQLLIFLLTYKLCEVGCLNMLPLYLVDKGASMANVGLWIGVCGQFASIFGSAFGGWLIKHHGSPIFSLYLYCLLRIPFMGIIVLLVYVEQSFGGVHTNALVILMNILLLLSGIVTTITFTIMMECSQTAAENVQATHYTTLATAEVLGKLLFAVAAGGVTDYFGYLKAYCLYFSLALFAVFYIKRNERQLTFKRVSK